MSKLIILAFIVGLCLCETTINIHNQGCSSTCGQNPTPASQYNYATSYGSNNGYYDYNFLRELWDAMLKTTPELKGHLSPIPYLNTSQILNLTDTCLYNMDVFLFSTLPYFDRGVYSTIQIVRRQEKYDYVLAATNLQKSATTDAASTAYCDNEYPTCSAAGKCSKGNFQEIATYASSKNNPPVTIYYYSNVTGFSTLLSLERATMLKTELSALGLNVTLTKFGVADYDTVIGAVALTNPATRILFAIHPNFYDADCSRITNYPIRVYEFHSQPYWNGFPICPSSFQLKTLVADTVNKMYNDLSICRILAKYGGCKSEKPYIDANPLETCHSWSEYPVCNCKKDESASLDPSNQISTKILRGN